MTIDVYSRGKDGMSAGKKMNNCVQPKHGNFSELSEGYDGKGRNVYFVIVHRNGQRSFTHEFGLNENEARNFARHG